MQNNNYTRYKTYAGLNELANIHNPSDFGRINQALLAIAFQNAGYGISHYQGTGRPDFIAYTEKSGYAIEVKAPVATQVSLSEGDITGVEKLGYMPILAILTYPSIESRWIFISTNTLAAKTYKKLDIERLSIKNIEEELAEPFLKALEDNKEKAEIGASALQSLIQSK